MYLVFSRFVCRLILLATNKAYVFFGLVRMLAFKTHAASE